MESGGVFSLLDTTKERDVDWGSGRKVKITTDTLKAVAKILILISAKNKKSLLQKLPHDLDHANTF